MPPGKNLGKSRECSVEVRNRVSRGFLSSRRAAEVGRGANEEAPMHEGVSERRNDKTRAGKGVVNVHLGLFSQYS